ncbi:MAG: hypothetical protein IPH00_10530 [Flavobacteriales bacterium]|nr:hypothetical protein [Flavobacteriales bacterium]
MGLFNYGIEVDATNNALRTTDFYGYIKALNLMGGTTAQLYGLRSNATATAGTVVNNAKGVWGSAGNGIVNYGLYGDASGGVTNYATCSGCFRWYRLNYGPTRLEQEVQAPLTLGSEPLLLRRMRPRYAMEYMHGFRSG